MKMIYTCTIYAYLLAIYLASLFNRKARLWTAGRRGWREYLSQQLAGVGDRPLLWIHCASLGEFEQGRPVIEGLKNKRQDIFVLLTFFSSSGYEIRKNYPYADAVAYLPGDTPGNARYFMKIVRPQLIIFVKYEFWFNLLWEIRRRDVPALLISARFRTGQVFFRAYGTWFRHRLKAFSKIFLQENISSAQAAALDIPVRVAGDTRVDRVLGIVSENRAFPEIARFCDGHQILIAGSTWPPDEALIAKLVQQPCFEGWKLIIAPHDVSPKRLNAVEAKIPLPACRHSALCRGESAPAARMLIIDHVGILSALYRYGHIAYIGGAFGSGLHNILEPIAFRLPVIFGRRYDKFPEAVSLLKSGGARSVQNPTALIEAFTRWTEDEQRNTAAQLAFRYVQDNRGASAVILEEIEKLL